MRLRIYTILLLLLAAAASSAESTYFGFDRNSYPGDDLLPALHKSFAFTSYWLNSPPGATSNSWKGKRSLLLQNGFGFLVLFNGRLDAQLRKNAAALGRADAAAAVAAAKREGFAQNTIVFLDVEEGGRLLPEHLAYILAWADALRQAAYRAGVYCSGIPVPDGPGQTITTAQDLRSHDSSIALFVYNDLCPPAPGCVIPTAPLPLSSSGTADALVWQFAQSPRRPEYTSRCFRSYSADNNCYAPGIAKGPRTFIDMNVSSTADPSAGR